MTVDDLDSTGIRCALVTAAHDAAHESAEALNRAVAALRDHLPAPAQKELAVAFEWAREGIAIQIARNETPELAALHAAYTYARDVLTARAAKAGDTSESVVRPHGAAPLEREA